MNNFVSAITVSKFFIKNKKELFNSNQFTTINKCKINKGVLILCKYLHLSQILFFAKYEKLLFEDELLAFTNRAIVNSIRMNFNILNYPNDALFNFNDIGRELNFDEQDFLKRILIFLSGADYKELINLSHIDPARGSIHYS